MLLEWNLYGSEYHQQWFMSTSDTSRTIQTNMYSPEDTFNLTCSLIDQDNVTTWYGVITGRLKESTPFVPLTLQRIVPSVLMGEQAPYITSITHNVSLVRPGDPVRLTLTVHDPNNDPIYFLTCQDTVRCTTSTCECDVIVPSTYQLSLTVRDSTRRVSPPFIVTFTKRMSFDWTIETTFNMPPTLLLEAPSVFTTPTNLHVHINDSDVPFTYQWYTKRVKGLCNVLDATSSTTSQHDIVRHIDPPNITSICVYGLSVADRFGSVSSSEVIIRSRVVTRHTPPETIQKIQSSSTASYGDRVDFRVYACHALDIRWLSTCGALKYQTMLLDPDSCLWSSNFVVANGQSCTIKYILNGRYKQSVGFFRVETTRRLQTLPSIKVRWTAKELETVWGTHNKHHVQPTTNNPGITIVLIFAGFLFMFGMAVMRRLSSTKNIKYVQAAQEEPEQPEDMSKQFKDNSKKMSTYHKKMRREARQAWYKERHKHRYKRVLNQLLTYKRPTALDRVKRQLKLNGLRYIK